MSFGNVIGHTYFKSEKEKDKLRLAGGSWSVNVKEVVDKPVKTIKYQTEKHIYTIDYHTANNKGFKREFKGELKLIIPIKHWTIL